MGEFGPVIFLVSSWLAACAFGVFLGKRKVGRENATNHIQAYHWSAVYLNGDGGYHISSGFMSIHNPDFTDSEKAKEVREFIAAKMEPPRDANEVAILSLTAL